MNTFTEIKGYIVQKHIGSGTFGDVYQATRPVIGGDVAIKVINSEYANQPEFIRRFESEAQMIAHLDHLHIVQLYDYWRDPDGAYLVMRWLRGGNLKEALKQGALELETAHLILEQIAAALAHAHRNGVIHRDLKPANILFDEDGNAYLADFGIAKNLGQPGQGTEEGSFLGTIGYSAPEQIRGGNVSPQTDVYSLGVILYEMLTGEHPYPNLNGVEVIYKSLNDPVPLITSLDAQIRDDVNEIIQLATAKDPQNRYTDPLVMAIAFRDIATDIGESSPESIVESLTPREQEILQLMIANKSNREIATELFIALSTVKWNINNIYKKLRVRTRVQAITKGRELNFAIHKPAGNGHIDYRSTYLFSGELTNPYKGLDAFTLADEKDFYGRTKVIAKLMKRLNDASPYQRFLAILGPSGSGKSSLVRAGLIPAVLRERPIEESWYIADMIPGTRPLDKLEVALTRVAADQSANIGEQLARDEWGLVRVADIILPDDGQTELLVVIDQFEEVFTLVEDESARSHFLNLLVTAVTEPRSRVRVVVTLRADYFDRPLQYSKLGEILRERMETILPLSAEELEAAITQPAGKLGVTFEPGLVSAIISEINYQPGALPLLQYALMELFDQQENRVITQAAYQAIGGTVGALANRADATYAGLTPEGQALARQMFMRMVTLGEGAEDTRRRVTQQELYGLTDNPDLLDDVLNAFATTRLLSLDHDPATREPTVEVAHEAILREWEHLRTWLNDSRDDIKRQRRLATAAQTWLDNQQDSSFVLRGANLRSFEDWVNETNIALTQSEEDFFEASLIQRHQEQDLEAERVAQKGRLEKRANRVLQGLVAVFLIAAVISGGLALFAFDKQAEANEQTVNANNERDNARAEQQVAQREAQIAQSIALAAESQEILSNGDHDLALILALEANNIDNPPIEAERALFAATYAPGTRLVMEGHEGTVSTVDISPDGRSGASAGGKQWVAENELNNRNVTYDSEDFSIRLWDLQKGEEKDRFEGHTDAIWDVEFSPDGKTLLSASSDGTLILWDVESGAIIHQMEGNTWRVGAIAYYLDSRFAISSNANSTIVWNLQTGEIQQEIYLGRFDMWDIDISPNGEYALFAMRQKGGAKPKNGYAVLLDLNTYEQILQFDTPGPVDHVAFSPDGKTALIGTHDDAEQSIANRPSLPIVIHLNLVTGEEITRFYHTGSFITGVDFSPDGKFAISTTISQGVYMWDLHTGENVVRMIGHEDWITDMALSPNGNQLLTGSDDGTVRLWDLRNGTEELRINASPVNEHKFELSLDGQLVAMSSSRRRLLVWDLQTSQIVHDLGLSELSINALAFSPDSKKLAVESGRLLTIYDMGSGQKLLETYIEPQFRGFEFTKDGRYLFGATERTDIIGAPRSRSALVDTTNGQVIREYRGSEVWSNSIALSEDGQIGYGVGYDGNVYMWNLASTEEFKHFGSPLGQRLGLKVDHDNHILLTSSEHIEILMWDIENGTLIRELEGQSDFTSALDMNPAGTRAVSASFAKEVIIWDLISGQEERRISGLEHIVNAVYFLPTEQRIVGLTWGGDIVIWRINDTREETIGWAYQNRYIRDFTCLERERYNITPLCGDATEKSQITPSPYPTLTPSLTPSLTPTNHPNQVTPTWTAIPSYTPLPSATPLSVNTPTNQGSIVDGVLINGFISGAGVGELFDINHWTYEGTSGSTITINFTQFGMILSVISPSGEILVDKSTATSIGPINLSEDGSYIIEITGDFRAGVYTLSLNES